MENELAPNVTRSGGNAAGCLLWFLGGVSLSLMVMLSLVLTILLLGSLTLNAYLGWRLSNLQITISQKPPDTPQVIVVTPTPVIAAQPVANSAAPQSPVATATPVPPGVQLQTQMATVAAITTKVAQPPADAAAFVPPMATTAGAAPLNPAQPAAAVAPATPAASAKTAGGTPVAAAAAAESTSNNTYTLIPIDGERESRPAETHGDLNLKLRDPQPIKVDLKLVTIAGSGIDPEAPKFSKVFKPDFTQAYAVHGWDWAKNDKSDLINDGKAILVGIKTNPGDPIRIPPTSRDIYEGKYYATVLYADKDSLTFVYARRGNVVQGYTVHLVGLETDPNLIKAFQESKGNMLPGLTLDTPVGRATQNLMVAIRDNGTFLDARSQKDWWD